MAYKGRERDTANVRAYRSAPRRLAQQLNAKLMEPGDFEQGLNAAGAIGDDRLQRQAQGHVVPEAFTHGTSEQRQRWLWRGMTTGESSNAIRSRRSLYDQRCHGNSAIGQSRLAKLDAMTCR